MSIVAEAPGYLQVFSDGSVKRFALETASPSLNNTTNGYKSKDVVIDQEKPITARIFLPETPTSAGNLPVLVYFHGGGFCIGSTTWLGYHHFLGDLSVESQTIILSIDHRLAPENRLPAAYDDCYASLEWLSGQSEPWLESVDLSRVFLSGDSAGGNITHNVAFKAMKNKIPHIKIKGLVLIHPYFGSEERTMKEMGDEAHQDVAMNDMFWKLSLPEGSNRDYYGCNYEKEKEIGEEEWMDFPGTLVFVAEFDFLKERGEMYEEFLKKKGVKCVKLIEAKGEGHVFHVFNPKCEGTRLLQKQMSEFMMSLSSCNLA